MSTITQQTTHRNGRFESRRRHCRGAEGGRPQALRATVGGHGTLEDLIVAAMDSVTSADSAKCPVCRAPELTSAGCQRCGSHLS